MIQGCEWTLGFSFSHNVNLLLRTPKLSLVMVFYKKKSLLKFSCIVVQSYKHVILFTVKGENFRITFNKEFLLTKFTVQKFPHLWYGGYISTAQDMVIITTETLTVASGHEQLETIVAGRDPMLYEKLFELVMWVKCATVKCCI